MCGPEARASAVNLLFEYVRYNSRGLCVVSMRHAFSGIFVSVSRLSRRLKGDRMSYILIILAIFLVWFLLQVYILPKLGIST
jgi:hypothetical protein